MKNTCIKQRLTEKEIEIIEGKIEYKFKNKELLNQAFTRKSFGVQYKVPYNSALKIFGDTILKTLAVKEASNSLAFKFEDDRGQINIYDNFYETLEIFGKYGLNSIESIIQEEYIERLYGTRILAISILELSLEKFMLVNKSDIKMNIYKNWDALSELFKAIIGAVAVDSKWDWNKIEFTKETILDEEEIKHGSLKQSNFVSSFEEWYNLYINELVEYIYTEDDGVYKCTVTFSYNNKDYVFEGAGKNKKEARKQCCENAMLKLNNEKLLSNNKKMEIILSKFTVGNEINVLQELYQKKLIPEPKYEFETKYDENGNPIWKCKLNLAIKIKSTNQIFEFNSSAYPAAGKVEAKKNIVFSNLTLIKDLIITKEDFEIIEIK